jgi:hypothetical protein
MKNDMLIPKGVFGIPKLPYSEFVPELYRNRFTTRALIANLNNSGASNIVNEILPKDYLGYNDKDLIKTLEEQIVNQIRAITNLDLISDKQLELIFHSIQIWGGNTARGFYLRNGGFNNNFNINFYRNGLKSLISGDIISAINSFKELGQMNIAFASKHFSFWSKSAQGTDNYGFRQFPILDSIIFKLAYGKVNPNYRHYVQYLNDIYDECAKLKIDVHSLERQLFNFSDTSQGRIWMENRIFK